MGHPPGRGKLATTLDPESLRATGAGGEKVSPPSLETVSIMSQAASPPHSLLQRGVAPVARSRGSPLFSFTRFSRGSRWPSAENLGPDSSSGDLGYVTGAYQITRNDPAGKLAAENGKYVEVWKKQNGVWKAMEFIFNPDTDRGR